MKYKTTNSRIKIYGKCHRRQESLNYLLLRDINVWMVKSQFEQPVPVASPEGFWKLVKLQPVYSTVQLASDSLGATGSELSL